MGFIETSHRLLNDICCETLAFAKSRFTRGELARITPRIVCVRGAGSCLPRAERRD
jgi:hypothetical protein